MLKQLCKIAQRHESNIISAFFYECYIRLYTFKYFRFLLKQLSKRNKPLNVYFVFGCYNSGTTIVKRAVGLHPDIAVAPVEGDVLTDEFNTFESGGWPRCMYSNSYEIEEDRKNTILDASRILSDWRPWLRANKFFVDKSISHSMRIPHLRSAFNKPQFIYVTRQLEGVVHGIQKRSKPHGPALLFCEKEYSGQLLRRQWQYFHETVLKDIQDNDDILIVSYERFLSDPKEITAQMHSFLGLKPKKILFTAGVLSCAGKKINVKNKKDSLNSASWLESETDLRNSIEAICNVV